MSNNFTNKKDKLILGCLDKPCFFHRKAGEEFALTELVPTSRICPKAFYTAYPYFLGLLYGAWKKSSNAGISFNCSCDGATVTWIIRVLPSMFSLMVKIAELCLRILGRHLDLPSKVVVIRTISVTGECKQAHSPGQQFCLDLRRRISGKKIFCPQSFYTVYPYLTKKDKQLCTPWDTDQVVCPAVEQRATYYTGSFAGAQKKN